MRYWLRFAAVVTALSFAAAGAWAQSASTEGAAARGAGPQLSAPSPQAGFVFVPESSRPTPPGFAHTNYVLRSVDGSKPKGTPSPTEVEPVYGPLLASEDGAGPLITTVEVGETPRSMGCLYVHSPSYAGCAPHGFSDTGGPSSAGYGAIAIVDAFDNPDAASDLATFDTQWGLAAPPSFTKIYANGNGDCTAPPPDMGWAVEESLDIEWSHVFAPKAAIILVEACSNGFNDMHYAEQVAFTYIATNFKGTGGQVTNSYTFGEFSTQTTYDFDYADGPYTSFAPYTTHVTAFASAGDGGLGVAWPSSDPWVVAAGGTGVLRNSSTLAFVSEACWGGSGGGTSTYETWQPHANYQFQIFSEGNRATPDFSSNADPASGVYFYSLYGFGGWGTVGGTSVSSPSLAGIVNRAGNRLGSFYVALPIDPGYYNAEENNLLYSQLGTAVLYKSNFYDVKTGSNGSSAQTGWDYCTGVGTPRGTAGR